MKQYGIFLLFECYLKTIASKLWRVGIEWANSVGAQDNRSGGNGLEIDLEDQ